jgi:hypothetical protein
MRSSSQVPQEAELQFHHSEDVSNGPISLGNGDYGSISRRPFPCISTKSPPLDESGYPSDGSTPCSTDSPHTPERDLDVAEPTVRHDLDHHADSASDPLRLAHSGPHAHSIPSQGDVGDKETRDHEAFYSIHPPADYLNYRQATQPLAQGHQGLLPKISRLDQPQHGGQAADAEQDDREPDSDHGTQLERDTLQERRTHSWQDSLSK